MNSSIKKTECPSIAQLTVLIEGDTVKDPAVASHIGSCADCQAQLDLLTEPDHLKLYGKVARKRRPKQNLLGPPQKPGDLGSLGEFSIESEIGVGGMGIVYRGRDERLSRPVAIKVLTCAATPTALARFERESQAASNLNHPNIVPVYSAGQSENGRPYLVMPLVECDSLKSSVVNGDMPFSKIAQHIRQIADALHIAHEAGLIHRDVKPANIILDDVEQQAKLLDFGLVRGVGDQTLTRTEMMCGTPEYMSPEQANAETAEARCDVYSLGITLYECLTGSVPFRGRPLDVLAQHRNLEPIAPSRMNKSVPQDLETICLKSIQKEPRSRYQSADEFANDLQRFIDHKPIHARPTSALEKSLRWANRNRALATSLSFLFISLLAGTIVSTALWLRSERNAALAESRNESLLASQKTLTDNQAKLWQTLRKTYQWQTTDINGPYSQMPTAVRNTLLTEMAVTYQLLFERGRDNRNQLSQMAEELAEVTEFALDRNMPMRASQLTELNKKIVDQLLDLEKQSTANDLILAARVYYQFSEARKHDETGVPVTGWQESIRLAELAREQCNGDSRHLAAEEAEVLAFGSRRGLLQLDSRKNKPATEEKLLKLLGEIELTEKNDEARPIWLTLKQKVLLDLARNSTGERKLDYRKRRQQVLSDHLDLMTEHVRFDYWLFRTQAVNQAMIGVAQDSLGLHEDARLSWSEAVRLLEQLTSDSPTNAQYRADYLEIMFLLANSDWQSDNRTEAMQKYLRAIEQFEILVQINSGDLELARRAAQVRGMIGNRFLTLEKHKEAAESFSKGANHIQGMDGEYQPDIYAHDQAMMHDLLAKAAATFDSAGMPQKSEEIKRQFTDKDAP